jgi:phosphoglucomutase
LKLIFENGDWLLMRASGTEPVVRIYAESSSLAESQKLAADAKAWVNG